MKLAEADITRAIEKKMDRSTWETWKFSDLVENVVEKVVPKEAGLKHYVGLKHLDTGSLHIRRFGESASIEGDKLKVYKGDFIFAKRNSYLKRVAIAKFDAVASAHALVLRARPENVLPELLAFFLLSENFWERAIEISVGSLSPTINWRVLAKQEFQLPPKDQQADIAKLFWAMDETVRKEIGLFDRLVKTKHSARKRIFSGYDKSLLRTSSALDVDYEYEILPFSKVCHVCNTLRKPINKQTRQSMAGEYPYYGPTGILDYIDEYRLDNEYVLIGEDGDHFLKYDDWRMTQHVNGKFNVNNHAHILKGGSRCLAKWIYFTFMHRNIIPHLTRQGATRYKLNKESLMNIPVIVPSVEVQKSLIKTLEGIEGTLTEIEVAVSKAKSLQKSLINQIF